MSQINGVVKGVVTNVNDPEQKGRLKVRFQSLEGQHETDWIQIATIGAKHSGSFFAPEIDDEVLIAFDGGDTRSPYVIGSLWNRRNKPPVRNEGPLVIEDAYGNTISMSNGKIVIKSPGIVEIKASMITINGRVVAPNANPI
ncbi:MAG TPA: phage baseplate assembly protein V [Candidatus Binatia bacterium]|jgi:phage baseplate assembly protein V